MTDLPNPPIIGCKSELADSIEGVKNIKVIDWINFEQGVTYHFEGEKKLEMAI